MEEQRERRNLEAARRVRRARYDAMPTALVGIPLFGPNCVRVLDWDLPLTPCLVLGGCHSSNPVCAVVHGGFADGQALFPA